MTKNLPKNTADVVFLDSEAVAALLQIRPATLRNYSYLQRLTVAERRKRRLQEPPKGMPKPQTYRGKLRWPSAPMREWIETYRTMKHVTTTVAKK